MKNDTDLFKAAEDSQGLTIHRGESLERREPTINEIAMSIAQRGDLAAVEAVERLFRLQVEKDAITAKQEFFKAFAAMQEEIPQMQKNGKNAQGKPFAEYHDVMYVLRPILAKHGFSISFNETAMNQHGITFELLLRHSGGHQESYSRTYPIDVAATNSNGKSIRPPIQDAGSTTSYARRYLIFQALNITSEDDTDGNDPTPISEEQVAFLDNLLIASGTTRKGFEMISGVPELSAIPKRDYQRCRTALETKMRLKK